MVHLEEDHYGGRARYEAIGWLIWGQKVYTEKPPMTMESAAKKRQEYLGRKFTLKQKRDFNRGWREGGVTTIARKEIVGICGYLNADQLDRLSNSLFDLYMQFHNELHRETQ